MSYGFFDSRFGIYAKSYVYSELFDMKHPFVASYMPNPVFGRNPVFAVREQLTDFHVLLTPDSENSWSKVPVVNWNSVFFLSDVRHTLNEYLLEKECFVKARQMHGLTKRRFSARLGAKKHVSTVTRERRKARAKKI